MKKLFPVLLMIMGFTSFLTIQIIHSYFNEKEHLVDPEQNVTKLKGIDKELSDAYMDIEFNFFGGGGLNTKDIKTPVVILNFWASWCHPCLAELPTLIELKNSYKDTALTIISINEDDKLTAKIMNNLKTKFKLDLPVALDTDGTLVELFEVFTLPTTFIIFNNEIVEKIIGQQDFMSKKFRKRIDSLLSINKY